MFSYAKMRSSSSSSSSSKQQQQQQKASMSPHIQTLYQRMCHALSLGLTRSEGEKRWQSTDIEVQRHALRSIEAFLDCASAKTTNHPLVKDLVADIVRALVGILECRSEAILSIAANVTVKLVSTLPNLKQQLQVLDLLRPLSLLLLSQQSQVALSCATAMNLLLSNMSLKKEREVSQILNQTNAVAHIHCCILGFSHNILPVEYFHEMATLLSTILSRWHSFRYHVWSNTELMKYLKVIREKPDISVKAAVFRLYSAIALCGVAAKGLLENDAELLQLMVHCMDSSYPTSVRVECFRLAQHLTAREEEFLKFISLCCEPVVNVIISGLTGWSLQHGKVDSDSMPLLMEACRLAVITRWGGGHHLHFWKQEIDRVLVYFLLDSTHIKLLSQHSLSLEDHMFLAEECLQSRFLLSLRPYVMEILGCMATHCSENFNPYTYGNEIYINILISCACLIFVDSIRKVRQLCDDDSVALIESASRAVVMMIYSPCEHIASKTAVILSKILRADGLEFVKYLTFILKYATMRDSIGYIDTLKIVISLMGIICYSALPQYHICLTECRASETLLAFIKWCISNPIDIRSVRTFFNSTNGRTCCWAFEGNWEDENNFLTLGLWALAALLQNSDINKLDMSSLSLESNGAPLVDKLKEITCGDAFAPGSRWYAAYILSHTGSFGFRTNLGNRIGKAFNENENSDLQLNFVNGGSVSVHAIILMVRCPSLLPPEDLALVEKVAGDSLVKENMEKQCVRSKRTVRLSARVDHKAMAKLLEFVYSGYIQAEEDLIRNLKILAKRCKLQPLSQLLYRKIPKWGTPIPLFDLTFALGPAGHQFSDLILEAKAAEHLNWACSVCSMSVPHMHVHKVVLLSSCDYLQALFRSGMQESYGQIIKVPVSWGALTMLVKWFYSDKLPGLPYPCLWDNMNTEEKLQVLKPYLELCWLAEFWFLEEIEKASTSLIISSLESARLVSLQVMKRAADLSLWDLAQVAAKCVAPLYSQLRDSGDFEGLDDELVNMVRSEAVRLSHGGGVRRG